MIILKNFISIDNLEKRWGLDKKQIEAFTYDRGDDEPRLFMWYATEIRTRPDGGQSAFVKRAQSLNDCTFDMADVLEIEKLNPELVRTEIVQCDSEQKMMGDKFIFTECQLIKKEDLYKRWFGATCEEIARHFDAGELRAYEHYKGPINGVVWCDTGHIYCEDRLDYSNSGLYEYHDDQCSYFLLADVVRCEDKHPEYTGHVTPESLGLIHDEPSGVPEEVADSDASPLADIPFSTEAVYTSDLESQLTEAQEQNGSLCQWNIRLNAQNRELREQITEKDSRLAELENLLASPLKITDTEQLTTRTQAATEARQEKVLDTWKVAFKTMIKVIQQCHADGQKKRTKAELQTMSSKHGGRLTTAQLEFLRDCLPDEHVNREGGPAIQSRPLPTTSNTVL